MSDRKKVLVIDDDPNMVTYLTVLLEDNGYDTASAGNGTEGLQKTRSERPDLVLLDISMPERSGVKFYRDVRADEELKDLPVVMVTGIREEFEKFISSRRQVPPPDGFFSKPVDRGALLEAISGLLSAG